MPDALRDHAALVFADTLGAILAGHREASVAAIVARHATGGVPLIGAAAAAPPPPSPRCAAVMRRAPRRCWRWRRARVR